MSDALQKRLEALLQLTKRGVGGEAVNAKAALDRLLEKHGMTLADIADDQAETVWFAYRTRGERTILFHLASRVTGNWDLTGWKYHYKRQIGFDLTKTEAIQMRE